MNEVARFSGRLAVVACLGGLALGCVSTKPVPAGELTPYQHRISDEAIARDLAEFDRWQSRLGGVPAPENGSQAYYQSKAAHWLALSRQEYQVNDRTGVVEAAFAEAKRLIGRLESGRVPRISETLLPPGSIRLREDLWNLSEELKDHRGFQCAAGAIARLEVELVWAGNVELTCGPNDPRHHLAAAEAAADEARRLAERCNVVPDVEPRVRRRTATPKLESVPTPVPSTLVVPNVIHFAFDKATISSQSVAILNRIAEVVKLYPDLRVLMFGHTDRRGSDMYNYALARRRADSAYVRLVESGVDPSQLRVVSEGEARLIRGEESNVAHAYNRRVEFEFYTSVGRRIETVFQESDLQPEPETKSPKQ